MEDQYVPEDIPSDVFDCINGFTDFTCPQQREKLVKKVDDDLYLIRKNFGRLRRADCMKNRIKCHKRFQGNERMHDGHVIRMYTDKYCHHHARDAIRRAISLIVEGKDYDKSIVANGCLLSVFLSFAVERNISDQVGTTTLPDWVLFRTTSRLIVEVTKSIIRDMLIQRKITHFSCFQDVVVQLIELTSNLKHMEIPRADGYKTIGTIMDENTFEINFNRILCFCVASHVNRFFEEGINETNVSSLGSFFVELTSWFSTLGFAVKFPSLDELKLTEIVRDNPLKSVLFSLNRSE
ncbi:hypothetical protein P9112_008330 [Eukaryota sp. TZLM1-RC]